MERRPNLLTHAIRWQSVPHYYFYVVPEQFEQGFREIDGPKLPFRIHVGECWVLGRYVGGLCKSLFIGSRGIVMVEILGFKVLIQILSSYKSCVYMCVCVCARARASMQVYVHILEM